VLLCGHAPFHPGAATRFCDPARRSVDAWTTSLHSPNFAAAVARAGLDPDTTFYSLRHSYISRALGAGVPTKAVAIHCGTSAAMIERFYAKFIPDDQARYATAAAPEIRSSEAAERVVPFPGAR
jgi:integrase